MIAKAAVTREQLQERFETTLWLADSVDNPEVKEMLKAEAGTIWSLIWYFFEYDKKDI
jgi:hypothetical protein